MSANLLAMIFVLAAPVPEDKDEKAALDGLRGEWVVTSSEEFGRAGELHTGDVLTFDGESLSHAVDKGKALKYRIRVAPNASPSRLDWRCVEGRADVWSHRGIYKLDGDKLTVCLLTRFDAAEAQDRPTEFRTQKGREKGGAAGEVLLVLERKKK